MRFDGFCRLKNGGYVVDTHITHPKNRRFWVTRFRTRRQCHMLDTNSLNFSERSLNLRVFIHVLFWKTSSGTWWKLLRAFEVAKTWFWCRHWLQGPGWNWWQLSTDLVFVFVFFNQIFLVCSNWIFCFDILRVNIFVLLHLSCLRCYVLVTGDH